MIYTYTYVRGPNLSLSPSLPPSIPPRSPGFFVCLFVFFSSFRTRVERVICGFGGLDIIGRDHLSIITTVIPRYLGTYLLKNHPPPPFFSPTPPPTPPPHTTTLYHHIPPPYTPTVQNSFNHMLLINQHPPALPRAVTNDEKLVHHPS